MEVLLKLSSLFFLMWACRSVEDHYLALSKVNLSLTCTQEVTGSNPVRSTNSYIKMSIKILTALYILFLYANFISEREVIRSEIIVRLKIRNFLILFLIFNINMKFYFSLLMLVLFLFQTTDDLEVFNFILVFLGIILLIIILVYILLTSKQEK